jgi:hypothetical protein
MTGEPFDPLPEELDDPLDDPQVVELLHEGARRRGMSPSAYLTVLIDCERRGVKPLWRQDGPGG